MFDWFRNLIKPKPKVLPISFESLFPSSIHISPCPPEYLDTGFCACMDCPIKSSCLIEHAIWKMGCREKVITSCSRKRILLDEKEGYEKRDKLCRGCSQSNLEVAKDKHQ